MKKTIVITAAFCLTVLAAPAQEVVTGVEARGFKVSRNDGYLTVDFELDLTGLDVTRNRAVLLTPCLINGNDSLHFESVGVYGRRRYYQTLRNFGEGMLTGGKETAYRAKNRPATFNYHEVLPYQGWMDGMDAQLHRDLYGCCEQILDEETGLLGGYAVYVPELLYMKPVAEVKTRSVEGSAYIDFVVNKTTIDPKYRNNPVELAKVNATIDSVRADQDITITGVWLKGYASPEGSYPHNRELAQGRVDALKEYIQSLYRFDNNVITTEYEPEDWDGLRTYVENSSLEHKTEILALIDGDLEPDPKEREIKSAYPTEYRTLLNDCYPALRHTDYRVNYTVRGYSDVEEIREILKTQPQKLSLNEMYLVAQTLEPGTEEFADVFETAVRMYPEDETANLNAANAAMRRNDFPSAKRYLEKAGESGEAEYARGVLAYYGEDFEEAKVHLTKASEAGVTQAAALLKALGSAE